MSGGSFDYAYIRVSNFVDELVSRIQEDKQELNPETIDRLKQVASMADLTAKLMKEAEWLYSGDTGEETFCKAVEELLYDLDH